MKKTLMIISLLIVLMMLFIPCTNAIQAQTVKDQIEEKAKLTKFAEVVNKLVENINLGSKSQNNILEGLKLILTGLLLIIPTLLYSTVCIGHMLSIALIFAMMERIQKGGPDVPFPIILTPIFFWITVFTMPYVIIKGGFLTIIKGSWDKGDAPIYYSMRDYVLEVIPFGDPIYLLLLLLLGIPISSDYE